MKSKHIITLALIFLLPLPIIAMAGEDDPADSDDTAPTQEIAAEQDESASEPVIQTANEEEVAAAVFELDHESYSVALTPSEEEGAELNLSVLPKFGFHINVDYPWKLTLSDSDATVYKKAEFSLTEEEAALLLANAEVEGELKFSVCNDATCLVETVSLTTAE